MREELLKKFAEDDRLEQLNEQKRRMKAASASDAQAVVTDKFSWLVAVSDCRLQEGFETSEPCSFQLPGRATQAGGRAVGGTSTRDVLHPRLALEDHTVPKFTGHSEQPWVALSGMNLPGLKSVKSKTPFARMRTSAD